MFSLCHCTFTSVEEPHVSSSEFTINYFSRKIFSHNQGYKENTFLNLKDTGVNCGSYSGLRLYIFYVAILDTKCTYQLRSGYPSVVEVLEE